VSTGKGEAQDTVMIPKVNGICEERAAGPRCPEESGWKVKSQLSIFR
jgi:hypothetical protein